MSYRMPVPRPVLAIVLLVLLAAVLAPDASAAVFSAPRRVEIRGYAGDAMEPFVSRDGRYLLFNDSNAPGRDTQLHVAAWIDELTFEYLGPLTGANSPALDAVASLDRDGRLVFVSSRSYPVTLSTLYEGRFSGGEVTGVRLLSGLSRGIPGWVNFDAELSADGTTLYFVDGRFGATPPPVEADLVIAQRQGASFERLEASDRLLAAINTTALEYAPAISTDGLELFFTRLDPTVGLPRILRSVRSSPDDPFGPPEPVSAAAGFVEAPALSPDERSLYYHRLDGSVFAVYRVTREGTGCGEPFVCQPSATALCLLGGRYRVTAEWQDHQGGNGPARVVPFSSDDSGLLWFFAEDNWEMLVKVLDGCAVNGHRWVFAAATTNVAYQLTVTDSATGCSSTYQNTPGVRSPAITDTAAFGDCP
jgi:hypothetical protein